jgi:hypothetical protein
VPTEGESSMVTVDAALDFIRDSARKKEPFLAVVWFGSPHAPHQALEEDRKLYADQPKTLQNFSESTGVSPLWIASELSQWAVKFFQIILRRT